MLLNEKLLERIFDELEKIGKMQNYLHDRDWETTVSKFS